MRQKRLSPAATRGPPDGSALVLQQLLLVAHPRAPDRPLRGLGITTAGALKLRASYWLRVPALGMLRVRITARDAPRRGRSVYYFQVTTRLRSNTT
jgi:hypothetical protein